MTQIKMNQIKLNPNQNNIDLLLSEAGRTSSRSKDFRTGADLLIDKLNNKYKTVGWKVDLQEDFMNDGSRNNYRGTLAVKDALKIAGTIKKVQDTLRLYGLPILGSMDWHNKDSKEFTKNNKESNNVFPEHCLAETYGAEFIEEAKPKNPFYVNWHEQYDIGELTSDILNHEGEVIFRKDAFDVFSKEGNKYAGELVSALNIKNAFVYGVALEVCDHYAVSGLVDRGVNVFAITDAMKAIDENKRSFVLGAWEDLGVTLLTSDQLYHTIATIKIY